MSERSRHKLGPVILVAALAGIGLIGFAGFLFSGPRQAVDWSAIRAVVIESDDWGLPGFVPAPEAWDGLDRRELAPGAFPEVYWESTLENARMVTQLCDILARHPGQDGLPAVFQPNYVTGSWEWRPGPAEGVWREYSYPDLPQRYRRPGLEAAVEAGIEAGLWYPELHARWHYDPVMRKEQALSTPVAREATARGIMLFPGSEKARELGAWRPLADLDGELERSRAVFAEAFGRECGSIIAPDYTWNTRMEGLWDKHGLRVIQAKREQRNPELGQGYAARLKKYLLRKFELRRHPDRHYLERNCRLEPVQASDSEAVVARCLAETRMAWRTGRPAVVESHRVNFAHLNPEVVSRGQSALDSYLTLVGADPAQLPLFMTDVEIAQLQGRGLSWVRRGGNLIVRNGTRSSRVISLPEAAFGPENSVRPARPGQRLVKVPARTTVIVGSDGQTTSCPFDR